MDVRFVGPDLRKLDLLDVEVLATPIHSDERPLRGPAGLADWRLCGRLSRWVQRGRLTGVDGEVVLVPTSGRLSFDKLLLVGAGPTQAMNEAHARAVLQRMFHALDGLRVRRAALALPGRTIDALDAAKAMEVLAPITLARHEQDALHVVDELEAHRTMQRALDVARRKARAME